MSTGANNPGRGRRQARSDAGHGPAPDPGALSGEGENVKLGDVSRIRKVFLPLLLSRPAIFGRLLANVARANLLRRPVLKGVEFSVTADCNLKCPMCFASKYKRRDDRYLDAAEYRDVWRQCKRLGAVGSYLIGGEPSVRKGLLDILDAVEARRHLVGMVTNSKLLTRESLCALREHGLTFITFSLDSLDPAENDRSRTWQGHFDHVMRCVPWARKAGLLVEIGYVVSHSSLPHLDEVVAFTRKVGAVSISPSVMVPAGRWSDNQSERLTEADWARIVELEAGYPELRFDFTENLTFQPGCPGGIEKVCVSPYGDVLTCSVNPLSFGNVREEPVEAIWRRIQRFPYFRLGRNFPTCVMAADEGYYRDVLEPMAHIEENPVLVFDHPHAGQWGMERPPGLYERPQRA